MRCRLAGAGLLALLVVSVTPKLVLHERPGDESPNRLEAATRTMLVASGLAVATQPVSLDGKYHVLLVGGPACPRAAAILPTPQDGSTVSLIAAEAPRSSRTYYVYRGLPFSEPPRWQVLTGDTLHLLRHRAGLDREPPPFGFLTVVAPADCDPVASVPWKHVWEPTRDTRP